MTKPKNSFLKSKTGYAVVALVALLAAYIAVSRAIDTGSLIEYALSFVLLGFAVQRAVLIFRT